MSAGLVGMMAVWLAAPSPDSRPAGRFDDATFRRGLQSRGLVDLAEFFLRESPPADAVEAMLLERDLKLTRYADETRPEAERSAALTEADELLTELIRGHPADPRAFDWRLELARSVLYRHAEPPCERILYGTGTPEDGKRVLDLTTQAGERLTELAELLKKETERLNGLSTRDYDALEQRGHVDRIERMQPQVEYMGWWTTFYRALARPPADPARPSELKGLLAELSRPSGAMDTPHETSHVQAQCQLLAGMASRLLHDDAGAVRSLSSAISTVAGVKDAEERGSLNWVATLAMIERVRALRDDRQFDAAMKSLDELRGHVAATAPGDIRQELLAAMLERTVWQAQAERAADDGQEARRLREQSCRSLAELADRNETYRDAVYAALLSDIDSGVEVAALPSLEQRVVLAGLLRQAAATQPADRNALLGRAVTAAQRILLAGADLPEPARAEILFNLGVAHYQGGQRREAAARFLEVARTYPQFARAEMAARNAVQMASELYADPSLRAQPDIQTLYRDSLRTLTVQYPGTDVARYWQFFHAQMLEESGEYVSAAVEYDRVDDSHEHYFAALYAAVRCRVAAAGAAGADAPGQARAAALAAARLADTVRNRPAGSGQDESLNRRVAQARVLAAEAYLLPGVRQHQAALDLLADFESRFAGQGELIGRALRVRIVALESLGRLDEAKETIPRYVQSDPANAGATLQGLFDAIREEIDRLERAGQSAEAAAKAASAVMLADQIRDWATRREPPLSPTDLYAVELQLAEAHLRAGEWETALAMFDRCAQTDAQRHPDGAAGDPRVLLGQGESLVGLRRFEDALPVFNRIVRGSAQRDTVWWQALLRDLQCRTELRHDPEGVLKVIRQHRFLDAGMGGEPLRGQFQELERLNEQRRTAPHGRASPSPEREMSSDYS